MFAEDLPDSEFEVIYKLVDVDGSGEIAKQEMLILLKMICNF